MPVDLLGTLNYWTGYRTNTAALDTVAVAISTTSAEDAGVWDVGNWDEAYWDDYTVKLKPLVFNLRGETNGNNVGDAIKLQLTQTAADAPVTIYGYSIIYSEAGVEK
jgi:hypothetical protein